MANEKNLVPLNRRTKKEQREIQSKGGKASGEARRAQKTLKEYAEFLLSLPVRDGRKFNKMARAGVPPEGCDNKMLLVFGLMQTAQAGDVSAAKEMRSIIGEDKPHDMDALDKLDAIMKALDEGMKDGDA